MLGAPAHWPDLTCPQLAGFQVSIEGRGDHDQRRPTGLCSVCGGIIVSTADGSFESTYPDGRVFTFHGRCEQLWQEERYKPGRR